MMPSNTKAQFHVAFFMQECPSYGEMIDLLEDVEIEVAKENRPIADILVEKFTANYPHIPICRPSRFLDTVRRLAAPTKPSAVGKQKLIGSPLASYRRRHWMPRNRHKQGMLVCILDMYDVMLGSGVNFFGGCIQNFGREGGGLSGAANTCLPNTFLPGNQ